MTRAKFYDPHGPAPEVHANGLQGAIDIAHNAEDIHSVVGVVEDRAILVGGLRQSGPNLAEGFLVTTDELFQYPAVWVQLETEWARLAKPYRRVQMLIDLQRPENMRWAYHLGLKPEGVMRKAGMDGEDMVMFARVTE